MTDFKEAKGKPLPKIAPIQGTNPEDDPRYVALLTSLQTVHGTLLKTNLSENPALIGDYLGDLRLGANQLFAYLNIYIDVLTEAQVEHAARRQAIFESEIAQKKSPSAAETYAREMTRDSDANVKVIENRIQQIKNNYERFSGIAIYLQSRMKEFQSERFAG
jgi:hypothetical protein